MRLAEAAGLHEMLDGRLSTKSPNPVVKSTSVIAGCSAIRAKAWFSLTARMNPQIIAAIGGIGQTAWTAIRYPKAIFDEDEGRWISDAEVAETTITAFTSRPKADHVTCRLVVRRVKRLNPAARAGQGELFDAYRHHAFVTNSTLSTWKPMRVTASTRSSSKSSPSSRPARCPSTLRVISGRCRLVGPGGHRVQSHPRCRSGGLTRRAAWLKASGLNVAVPPVPITDVGGGPLDCRDPVHFLRLPGLRVALVAASCACTGRGRNSSCREESEGGSRQP